MLLPGSKGWINKYFDLVQRNEIVLFCELPQGVEKSAFIHAALGRTGILFGYPSRLQFAKELDAAKWTMEEKLKLLLFESLLFVYRVDQPDEVFNRDAFIQKLVDFYGHHSSSAITRLFSVFVKESADEKVESILAQRVEIRMNLLENKFWVNYLNNVFIYLDVILFNEFLKNRSDGALSNYDDLAMNALNAISMAAFSDGEINVKERTLFNLFLASANLSDLQRELAEQRFLSGSSYDDFSELVHKNWLFARFLIDLSAFVIFSNHEAVSAEKEFLASLCAFLRMDETELNEGLALVEQFILNNHDNIPFLNNSSAVEKVYSSLSSRWIKILGRNKDKLALELKQSKELVYLIRKSATTELTKEEKEVVKAQFKDIVRSMPSLAIFLLPGGAVLLPLVLKIIPDLVPSAFRDNEVKK